MIAKVTLQSPDHNCTFELDRNCLATLRTRLKMRETPDTPVVACLVHGMLSALVEFDSAAPHEDDTTKRRAYDRGRTFMQAYLKEDPE